MAPAQRGIPWCLNNIWVLIPRRLAVAVPISNRALILSGTNLSRVFPMKIPILGEVTEGYPDRDRRRGAAGRNWEKDY